MKEMTEAERLSTLAQLRSSYAMYEKAKKETEEKRNNLTDKNGNKIYNEESIKKTLSLMEKMQEDVKEEYLKYGGDIETIGDVIPTDSYKDEIKEEEQTVTENTQQETYMPNKEVLDYMNNVQNTFEIKKIKEIPSMPNSALDFDLTKIKEAFDVIPLPSKGECYPNKLGKLAVSYLTAYDENIIVSPNLYNDGTFLDYLIKAKVINPAVNTDNLLPGDRDAIILWLRATGYGNEFPVTVTDDETGKQFESVIDLSQIKYKDFTLHGDENGHFTFTLPVTKDEVKFKFLSYKDIEILNEIEKNESLSVKRNSLKSATDTITDLKNKHLTETFSKNLSKKIDDAIKTLDEWYYSIEVDEETTISRALTNRLIASIISINGINDEKYIREYVVKMNIKDSSALRKYIVNNEPGLDYTVEVERPKSLGGGSMKTFLTLDQFIFLNITE